MKKPIVVHSLIINDQRKLEEIQKDFSIHFPFLQVAFFKAPHKIGEGTAKKLLYNKSMLVKDCRMKHHNGSIDLTEQMTVSELEYLFQHDFGLPAQVFRRAGNVWLETSATDNWSLRQQNEEGAELSSGMNL
jgi:hypothetical protein